MTRVLNSAGLRCDGDDAESRGDSGTRGWRTSGDGKRHACPYCASLDDRFMPAVEPGQKFTAESLEALFREQDEFDDAMIDHWLDSALRRGQIVEVDAGTQTYRLADEPPFPYWSD